MDSAKRSDPPSQPGVSIGPLLIGFLVVAAAALPALTLWASNTAQVPKAYRLFLISGSFALLGLVIFRLLLRVTADSRVAAFITFFVLLILTSGGQILENRPWIWRWVAALVVVPVVVLVVIRLRDWWLLDVIILGSAAAVLVPSILTGVWATITSLEAPVQIPSSAPMPAMVAHPDIVFVVVDGYTSLPVVRELFGFEDPTLEEDLAGNGLEVVETAFSPYSMTHLTLSSLLELDYVAEEGPTTSTKNGRTLAQVMSGNSYLVELLVENGYRTTMVESGWHMSTCGDQIDLCVTAPFIDEGVGVVLSQSLVWSLIEPSIGSAYTNGARHAMAWATENVGELVNDETPDFIFVHVLAPHPPLFLDAECGTVPEDRRRLGVTVDLTGVSSETAQVRREGYVDQVKCVNRFVRQLADAVSGTDALVLVTGDHGSDAMSQLTTDPAQWSEPQMLERMSVFLAVKATTGCEDVSSLVTVAFFRALVSCAGDLGLDPIEEKAFLVSLAGIGDQGGMEMLETRELVRLATCLEAVVEDLKC